MTHAGIILARMLKSYGVPRVFSVPGESFLAALDGFIEVGLPNIVCRHEGGAAMMAESMGKMTGQPGIAFVTRGPGATNASAGVHIARQDSTPMILFVGQISRGHRDREAFQEVDYRAMFGPLAKWVAEIDDPDRLPEYVHRAFQIATSGRPGPVVLSLPEDMLSSACKTPPIAPTPPAMPSATRQNAHAIVDFLDGAERPLVIAGGSIWDAQASKNLATWSKQTGLPIAVTFRRQDYIDNDFENYVGDLSVGGNPELRQALVTADRILLLGSKLGDIATNGYETLRPDGDLPRIAHVHPDPDLPGAVYATALKISAKAPDMLQQLLEVEMPHNPHWYANTVKQRVAYESWQKPFETPGEVKLESVIGWLRDNLPNDAILTNGAGNYAAFLHRYYRFRTYGTQLAPTSGSMGYGFPASIAASLQHPDRQVVCLAGDGCFQMTLNEMSTAIQFGAKPIVIVANNGRYGTIRAHQERHYPGRVSGTEMHCPDFAALGVAYGGFGQVVTSNAEFADAFRVAQNSKLPAIIELRLDRKMLGTSSSLEAP